MTSSKKRQRVLPRPHYKDGPPQWEDRRSGKPAKSAAQAIKQLERDVRLLRKWQHLDYRADVLGDQIVSCLPAYRCGSAACASCWRAYQRLFVQAMQLVKARRSGPITAISIIPAEKIPIGQLSPEHFLDFGNQVRQALATAQIAYAIGGIDINVNEESPVAAPYWKLQAWLFTPKPPAAQIERLRAIFKVPKHEVHVPVQTQDFDGDNAGLAYALKGDFVRRQTIPRLQNEEGSCRRRNTRDRALRAEQAVELLIVRHELGFEGRLILHATKRQRGFSTVE